MSKPFLVLVHGYLGACTQWCGQMDAFSERFKVIRLDLPGYGENSHLESPVTIGGYAMYILAELDKQRIRTFHLLGHSMGGMIAQEIVARAPERVNMLILYATGPVGTIPGRFESIQESRQILQEQGVYKSARRIAAKWFVQHSNAPAYEACANIAIQTSLQAALAGLSAMQTWNGRHNLHNITSKTMVLWGEYDTTYLWPLQDELCQGIGTARLYVFAKCAHAVHLEKQDLFNNTVLEFLTGQ